MRWSNSLISFQRQQVTPGHLHLSAVESDPAVTEVSTPDTSPVTEENSRLALDRDLHYPGLTSSLDSRKDLVFGAGRGRSC